MTVWERVQEEFACECAELVVCKKPTSDGRHTYYRQCTRCGSAKVIKKAEAEKTMWGRPVPDFDERSKAEWEGRKTARFRQIQETEREEQSAEWWRSYEAYLGTRKWQLKRDAVLKRDDYLCQACLSRRATQCHHLSYKHVFDEPLFELIAVCDQCHRKITGMDRAARAG